MNKNSVILPWPYKQLSPNARVHFMTLAKFKRVYRSACFVLAKQAKLDVPDGDIRIVLEFYPPTKRNRDDDNLVAMMKCGLDGVADALGVNDSRFRLQPPVVMPEQGGYVRLTVGAV